MANNLWWSNTEESTATLTLDALQRAVEALTVEELTEANARCERYAAFYAAVPEHLRDHPDVALVATVVGEGLIVSPKQAEVLRAKMAAALGSADG